MKGEPLNIHTLNFKYKCFSLEFFIVVLKEDGIATLFFESIIP